MKAPLVQKGFQDEILNLSYRHFNRTLRFRRIHVQVEAIFTHLHPILTEVVHERHEMQQGLELLHGLERWARQLGAVQDLFPWLGTDVRQREFNCWLWVLQFWNKLFKKIQLFNYTRIKFRKVFKNTSCFTFLNLDSHFWITNVRRLITFYKFWPVSKLSSWKIKSNFCRHQIPYSF